MNAKQEVTQFRQAVAKIAEAASAAATIDLDSFTEPQLRSMALRLRRALWTVDAAVSRCVADEVRLAELGEKRQIAARLQLDLQFALAEITQGY